MSDGATVGGRDLGAILADLERRAPGFVPEASGAFAADAPGSVGALARVFSRYTALFEAGLARVPDRSLLAFLDRAGADLLPSQSARTPLVFTLLPTSPQDVTLARGSQFAAKRVPPPPSAVRPAPIAPEPVIFSTESAVTITRARLVSLHSVVPGDDLWADHTSVIGPPTVPTREAIGLTLFGDLGPVMHTLYLGHDALFALAGPASVDLSLQMGPAPASFGLNLEWEYYGGGGWQALDVLEDETARFTNDGSITLRKRYGPDAEKTTVVGRESYWLRARVSQTPPGARIVGVSTDQLTLTLEGGGRVVAGDTVRVLGGDDDTATVTVAAGAAVTLDGPLAGTEPDSYLRLADPLPGLRRDAGTAPGTVPIVDTVRARVGFTKSGLGPDKAATDAAPVDTSNNFRPFGLQPTRYATFYLACKEAFQHADARAAVVFDLSDAGVPTNPLTLSWEYSTGYGWAALGQAYEFNDGTASFTKAGLQVVSFRCPRDWVDAEVVGHSSYWLRVRIDEGDYGHPLRLKATGSGPTTAVTTEESTLAPPVVSTVSVSYTYLTNPTPLQHCITENHSIAADHSEDAHWPRRTFAPFVPLEDREPAVHLGFDAPLPSGLVSLFVHVPATEGEAPPNASPFVWEYLSVDGWKEVGVVDDTAGFARSGTVQFVGAPDMTRRPGPGGDLYRIRARLPVGEPARPLPLRGLWLNAVWASHRREYERDILGDSDGTPFQSVFFGPGRPPVLEGEVVEVREWQGRGLGWETAVLGIPASDIRFERDSATQEVTAVWVRWHGRQHLLDAGPDDRAYTIERAAVRDEHTARAARVTAALRFGGDGRGLVPPAGSRIIASYASGGDVNGNVPPGVITELRTAAQYVQAVTNPLAATGGAATESLASARRRGPERLRHRSRGVAARDIEWLALDASPAVALARCLPLTGPDGFAQRGRFTVVIVPHGVEGAPDATPQLLNRVREYLADRAPASVAAKLRVVGPRYLSVGICARIAPGRPDEAALVEARVREAATAFLHPLTGGPQGVGWVFGGSVYLSQLAAIIEGLDGVDATLELRLVQGTDVAAGECVTLPSDALPCSGRHEITMTPTVHPAAAERV